MELACARLNVVLALNPDSHWALAEQGWLAYQQENWKKALLYLEQAVALQPSMASYHYRLVCSYSALCGVAVWLVSTDASDLQRVTFLNLQRVSLSMYSTLVLIAYDLQGLLYWKAGGLMSELKDKVLSQLLEAVKLDPTQSEFFRQLGHCYNRLAGDTQRAIRCYQKAVNLNLEDEEAGV